MVLCRLFLVPEFRLPCVHIIFSSVWVYEWPPFWEIAPHSVDHMSCLYFDYL